MSEIFNEYAKIAIEQGLVKEAQEKKPPRYDSRTWEDIQMLYGIKPDANRDNEKIEDKAHPDTAVVGRAYDAMNAVVEYLHQRQSVMIDVALRTPDGLLTQKRYVKAKSDLMNALVSVGFEMDKNDENDLMKLADNCAGQLQKKAFPWAAVGIASLLVPALAFSGWALWGDYSAQSVYANAEKVKEETADIAEEGVPWATNLIDEMNNLQDYAIDFRDTSNRLMAGIGGRVTYGGAVAAATKHQEDLRKMATYERVLKQELSNIDIWMGKTQVKPESEEVSSDLWAKMEKVWRTVVPSDMEDVQKALGGLRDAINETLQTNAAMRQESTRHSGSLEEAAKRFEGEPGTPMEEGLPKGITPLKPTYEIPGVARPYTGGFQGVEAPGEGSLKGWNG